jgi:hypothetical protein
MRIPPGGRAMAAGGAGDAWGWTSNHWHWTLGCRYLGSSKWIKIEAFEGYQNLSRLEYEPGPSDFIALQRVVAIIARNPFTYGLEPDSWAGRSAFMPLA